MIEQFPASADPDRPFIIVMSAVTLDGKMTVKRGVTSGSLGAYVTPNIVDFLHAARASVDAVMVGGTTIVVDNPSLTVRTIEGRNPIRIVVDPEGAVPLDAKIFHDKQAPTIVAVAEETPVERVNVLRDLDVNVIVAGAGRYVDIKELMKALTVQGVKSLLVEGGATLNWLVISAGVVDELRIIKVPIVTGERGAPSFTEAPGGSNPDNPLKMECKEVRTVGNCVVLYCKRVSE